MDTGFWAKCFLDLKKEMKRNDSILVHGVTPVDEADAKKLYNRVMSFTNAVFSEIETWIKRARFIRIR